jgi:hypothetical protein
MRSTPEKAPAFYLFLSSILGILIASEIFFMQKGISSNRLTIFSEIFLVFFLFFFMRRNFGVFTASVFVILLHSINFYSFLIDEEYKNQLTRFRGKLIQISEGYFGIKREEVK